MSAAPGTPGTDDGLPEGAAAGGGASAVVLVGFMGSGKSEVGRLVAGELGLPFIDTDALVEAEAGPIVTIFARDGERAFRDIERRVVLATLAALPSRAAVVALGGGAVSDGDVRAALRAAPCVAWLTAPVAALWERVRRAAACSGGGRPLARDEASFRALYDERLPLYREAATFEVVNDGRRPPADVAASIAQCVRKARVQTPRVPEGGPTSPRPEGAG